uniref:GTPase IMAP family member 5-like n=1 Tax=Monopterus albus TaxID=43700 RepID=UPI0009B43A07
SADCLRVRGLIEEKPIVLINTPDLLHPGVSQYKLTKHIDDCVRLSAPGPHVFLLVLQPEGFTEEQGLRLCTFLEYVSDRYCDHSLVLIPESREERSGVREGYMNHSPLKHMISLCRGPFLWRKTTEPSELLARLYQIVEENRGEHMRSEAFGDPASAPPGDQQRRRQETASPRSDTGKVTKSALRIVLLGKSEREKTRLGNFIIGTQGAHFQKQPPARQCVVTYGEWKEQSVVVVKVPNIFSLSEEMVKEELRSCESLCCPGQNVLLLLVKPSTFTEKKRETLKFIMRLFGGLAMRPKPALNLVVCGRRGAGKTSAAKTILGQTELHSVSNSPQCVKHQAEVCGRQVSLVELPALYGKPPEAVMEESLRCISLFGPEGVHALILVLPVDPLTDEDKGELETIRDTFGS